MANGIAFRAVDMSEWYFLDSESAVINDDGTVITETDSFNDEVAHYFGSFTSNPGEPYIEVTGGTLTGVDLFIDGVRQYNVTGLNADAVTIYNYLVEPTPAGALAMISYLFRSADTLNGSNFADVIKGFGGNDTINGKGGADNVNGGSGNDTIVWGAGDVVNGDVGTDILKVSAGNLNLVGITNQSQIVNVETINMTGNNSNTLTVGKQDVLDLSTTTNQLTVLGNPGDTVDLRGAWVLNSTVGSNEFWKLGTATVKVETELNVI